MQINFASLPLRILVVDDCHDVTASLCMLLQAWGHDGREANDGHFAVEVARTFRPEVVILDVVLGPRMSSYEVARRLRFDLKFDNLLLLCMSGYDLEIEMDVFREVRIDQLLTKPVDLESLRNLLNRHKIELRRMSDAKTTPTV